MRQGAPGVKFEHNAFALTTARGLTRDAQRWGWNGTRSRKSDVGKSRQTMVSARNMNRFLVDREQWPFVHEEPQNLGRG